MDADLTDGYSEPCVQCGVVSWGATEDGQFFCKSCHNVIEKRKDPEADLSTCFTNSRISHISKGKHGTREAWREWVVCEGFQMVLKHQAEAIVSLGVDPQFKTEVLWNFWTKYLQVSRQAFTDRPVRTESITSEVSVLRGSANDDTASGYSSDGQMSRCSGSSNASWYVKRDVMKSHNLMTMPQTLAMCFMALLWMREAVTLADFLRMVSENRIPYLSICDIFPDEMRLFGADGHIFQTTFIPTYSEVQGQVNHLARLINLPLFPGISEDCLLHPAPLTVRYLLEANLPNSLHLWVLKVIDRAGMGGQAFLTFDPGAQPSALPCYDLQAAAAIIVTLKLLFRLNDQAEWRTNDDPTSKRKRKVFVLRRWFGTVQPVLQRARQKRELNQTLRQWRTNKPLVLFHKKRRPILKRRRVVETLQSRFHTLLEDTPERPASTSFSSFQFRWGKVDGSDGPSLHHTRLDCFTKAAGARCLLNRKYWHPCLSKCKKRYCPDHFWEFEPSFPRMYVWLLDLFSFLLGVRQPKLHNEVLEVERRFLPVKTKRRRVTRRTTKPK